MESRILTGKPGSPMLPSKAYVGRTKSPSLLWGASSRMSVSQASRHPLLATATHNAPLLQSCQQGIRKISFLPALELTASLGVKDLPFTSAPCGTRRPAQVKRPRPPLALPSSPASKESTVLVSAGPCLKISNCGGAVCQCTWPAHRLDGELTATWATLAMPS